MKTNIQLAQTQVEQSQKLSADADKKLTETRVMEIERMAQHAAADEEEVPDAYLREDWEKQCIFAKVDMNGWMNDNWVVPHCVF